MEKNLEGRVATLEKQIRDLGEDKKPQRQSRLFSALAFVLLAFVFVYSAYSIPYVFSGGQVMSAAQVNANFADLENRINAMEKGIIFVTTAACPAGYSAYTQGDGRFILGTSGTVNIGTTGGSTSIAVANLPSHTHTMNFTSGDQSNNHTHTGTTNNDGSHSHTMVIGIGGTNRFLRGDGSTVGSDSSGSHTHNFTTNNANTGHTHNINGTTAATGSGSAYFQPYIQLKVCIKT